VNNSLPHFEKIAISGLDYLPSKRSCKNLVLDSASDAQSEIENDL
jgi:hypothetical protein